MTWGPITRPTQEKCQHCSHWDSDCLIFEVPDDPPQRIARCCRDCRDRLAQAWHEHHEKLLHMLEQAVVELRDPAVADNVTLQDGLGTVYELLAELVTLAGSTPSKMDDLIKARQKEKGGFSRRLVML